MPSLGHLGPRRDQIPGLGVKDGLKYPVLFVVLFGWYLEGIWIHCTDIMKKSYIFSGGIPDSLQIKHRFYFLAVGGVPNLCCTAIVHVARGGSLLELTYETFIGEALISIVLVAFLLVFSTGVWVIWSQAIGRWITYKKIKSRIKKDVQFWTDQQGEEDNGG